MGRSTHQPRLSLGFGDEFGKCNVRRGDEGNSDIRL
jgi:hypothetical protein